MKATPTRLLRRVFPYLPDWMLSALFPMARIVCSDDTHDPRAFYLEKSFQAVRHILGDDPGDYLEFGTFYGKSFAMAHLFARRTGFNKMRFFAFDSFEGFPHDEGTFRAGHLVVTKKFFSKYIKSRGVDTRRVVITEGIFKDSLTESVKTAHKLERASVVHLDCDLYESTRDALNFIEDLVQPNTILIFDDWRAYDYLEGPEKANAMGQQKAFAEWPLRHRCTEFYEFYQGKAFWMW